MLKNYMQKRIVISSSPQLSKMALAKSYLELTKLGAGVKSEMKVILWCHMTLHVERINWSTLLPLTRCRSHTLLSLVVTKIMASIPNSSCKSKAITSISIFYYWTVVITKIFQQPTLLFHWLRSP